MDISLGSIQIKASVVTRFISVLAHVFVNIRFSERSIIGTVIGQAPMLATDVSLVEAPDGFQVVVQVPALEDHEKTACSHVPEVFMAQIQTVNFATI